MAAKIPYGSVEYLHVPITLDEDVAGTATLTGVAVELAILAEGGSPTAPGVVWHATLVQGDAEEAFARYLLDGTLAVGRHDVWARITSAPEKVLRKAGILTVT